MQINLDDEFRRASFVARYLLRQSAFVRIWPVAEVQRDNQSIPV